MTTMQKISTVGVLAAITGAWFGFAGLPPYASATDLAETNVTARAALQQAMENRADAQRQRVFDQQFFIAKAGSTPERQRELKRLKAALKKYEEAKDRAYK